MRWASVRIPSYSGCFGCLAFFTGVNAGGKPMAVVGLASTEAPAFTRGVVGAPAFTRGVVAAHDSRSHQAHRSRGSAKLHALYGRTKMYRVP